MVAGPPPSPRRIVVGFLPRRKCTSGRARSFVGESVMTSLPANPMETTDVGDEPSGSSLRRALKLPNERIGDWLVERTLGAGAMGVVYACKHPETGRRAAIKVLHPRGYTEAALVAQDRWLQHEARALARLSHPGIVQVHGVGELDELRFMV